VGLCSEDRHIEDAETDADILYLRAASRIRASDPGWIEGRAVQNREFTTGQPAAPGASVSIKQAIRNATPKHFLIPASGAYRTPPLAPGQYEITFHSQILGRGAADVEEQPVIAHPGGCTVVNGSFETFAGIDGHVLGTDRKPSRNVRVELGEVRPTGEVRRMSNVWSNTSADGQFHLERIPLGRFVVGVNIGGTPRENEPFDPVYAPGTQSAARAQVLVITPNK